MTAGTPFSDWLLEQLRDDDMSTVVYIIEALSNPDLHTEGDGLYLARALSDIAESRGVFEKLTKRHSTC